ncbi:tRNA pseudouridine(55) synthase TruB [Protaetiibacter mangrovi]|uniref:tRNA pseudouridine synthase B n=1 Tax=Protaetiibacter mangrovi TaxID=2970926 RepID=A0ABT1ZBB2_9MICO|nr:tRNA pseudouridine(55) synthase TruB [Protaetiibacter mangrovi]MCS0497988.1 tRNA pseudouridine(55) synthase TruB [Protaetiibacter mangrovi]TPX02365.1 tRNA pseudouridine(55) synthase TruB [Schumannella luteola]
MTTGLLLVDKPQGVTSHDVVARARRLLGTRKVGHAGTLDPMATGLLLLGVGSATRLLTYLVGLDKEYAATIRLGARTDTDDAEGEVTATADASGVSDADIAAGVAALTGPIEQVPSTFSAIKVDGRRAYDRARAGEQVELASRPVTIHAFDVHAIRREGRLLDVDARVACSSGTYIRALARDLGAGLGVGGHLTALRRTRVGPFDVADALELPDPREHPDAPAPALLTSAEVAGRLFPVVRLDADATRDVAHGKRIELEAPDAAVAAALTPDGHLAALVELRGGRTRVLLGLPTAEVLP